MRREVQIRRATSDVQDKSSGNVEDFGGERNNIWKHSRKHEMGGDGTVTG